MTDRARSRAALTLTALGAAVIGLATLVPLPLAGPPGGDKLHHILAFAALVLPGTMLRLAWALPLLAFALGYGGLIEIVQPFVGRSGEWSDWLADAAGAVLGVLAGRGIAVLPRR